MVPFRMHDSGWLLLVLCMLFSIALCGLSRGMVLGYLVAASLVLHELGHIAASILFRVPVSEFGLCLGGAYNRRAYAGRRRDEAMISAAGPLMKLDVARDWDTARTLQYDALRCKSPANQVQRQIAHTRRDLGFQLGRRRDSFRQPACIHSARAAATAVAGLTASGFAVRTPIDEIETERLACNPGCLVCACVARLVEWDCGIRRACPSGFAAACSEMQAAYCCEG